VAQLARIQLGGHGEARFEHVATRGRRASDPVHDGNQGLAEHDDEERAEALRDVRDDDRVLLAGGPCSYRYQQVDQHRQGPEQVAKRDW
jgi:hypothetical protein